MSRWLMGSSGNEVATFSKGFVVSAEEVVVTLGDNLAQGSINAFDGYDGLDSEERAQDNHVVAFGAFEVEGGFHSVDALDSDVGALRRVVNTVGVVDEGSTGLDARFKLVEALLVENNGGVVGVEDGRADRLVAKNDSDIGGTTTLFGTIGGHPCDLEVVDQSGIGQNFSHGEYSLTSETGNNNFFFHDGSVFEILEIARGICGEHVLDHPLVGFLGCLLPSAAACADDLDYACAAFVEG